MVILEAVVYGAELHCITLGGIFLIFCHAHLQYIDEGVENVKHPCLTQ